jgi:hypothetical protein
VKEPAVPVGPVHHRRDAKPPGCYFHLIFLQINHLRNIGNRLISTNLTRLPRFVTRLDTKHPGWSMYPRLS